MKNYAKSLHKFWINHFLTRPSNLKALRITVSAVFSLFLFYLFGYPKWGLLVGLGIVATALTENDIHIKPAIKSTLIITVLFFIFSSLTKILMPYPWAFGSFLVIATLLLTIVGSYKSSYASLGFGSVLIIIYTMIIDAPEAGAWYLTPLLFCAGVLIYMSSTIILVYTNPFQALKNEVAMGYNMLGKYMKTKAKFFPSTAEEQEEIRNELALINIELFSQTEKIKALLQQYNQVISSHEQKKLQRYIFEWNRLQNMHERAVSSHEPYDLISKKAENAMLVKGFGKLLFEIGDATNHYAASVLKNTQYKTPSDLTWTKNALRILVEKDGYTEQGSISYLFNNISSIEESLSQNKYPEQKLISVKQEVGKWKDILAVKNARFRHAVRLSLCFLAGYIIMVTFDLPLGAWILLTSLIVCQQTYNATRQRFFRRIIGTLLGVLIGIILAILVPTPLGQLVILIISMYLFFKFLNTNYILAAIFITVYVLEVYNLQNGSGIAVMTPRIIDTLIGSILAYLSIMFIWPEWQYKHLKPLLIKAIDRNVRYLEAVMNKEIPDEAYLHHQRSAHRADNALTQVWKSMRIEPKSKRKLLTSARNFTYLNHTLLSYISAFGVHRQNLDFKDIDFAYLRDILFTLDEVKQYILGNQSLECPALEEILSDAQQAEETKGNELFLKNILNVSNEMKDAALEIKF
ncbi:MAG: FUSC family membrane protein [Weeksellaceae bacterium]